MFLAALCLASCDDYDDTSLWQKVNEHEERLAALEQWQEETNHNISAIRQLLNTTDCITAVTPLMEGGQEVGYTIQFLHSDPITIYHGTKGDTGHTPQIGLTQGDDGNWYWTLDGQLMQDADGNPIRPTVRTAQTEPMARMAQTAGRVRRDAPAHPPPRRKSSKAAQ